jgi:phosphopantothenoylcysteine decarboxylase
MNKILLGLTGSVATIKIDDLVTELGKHGDVALVATKAAQYFIDQVHKKTPLPYYDNIYHDDEEWPAEYKLSDPILHIELRRNSSALVIAPLDANTLAKIANGICDNLLTCVVRAWDWSRPMILVPAMNTFMWENSPTAEHIQIMRDRGAKIVYPVEKRLACNDVGMGAMAPVDSIAQALVNSLQWRFPLQECNGIPINHHPGAFGFHRSKNHHTGVDLYCKDGEDVFAVEDGIVVKVDIFTGPKLGHDWWEETYAIMVEGASGVVNYGELSKPAKYLTIGEKIRKGQIIGNVKRVLFENKHRADIPGHSTSMLHLELYQHGTREFADWHEPRKNPKLLDPTQHLLSAEYGTKKTLTWENAEAKTVG